MAAARRAWWRSPTNIAAASVAIAGGGFLGWALIQEHMARFAAQRYCEKQGGATINEAIVDDPIIGTLRPAIAPDENKETGAIERNGQGTLTQLSAVDAYYIKLFSDIPRGKMLSKLLEPEAFGIKYIMPRDTYIIPWDDVGPMIVAGPQSKYCKVTIDVSEFPPLKVYDYPTNIKGVRFCRPHSNDYEKIYLVGDSVINFPRVRLDEEHIQFDGWRIYRLGSTRPVVTSIDVGIHSVSSKLLEILFLFVGGDIRHYGTMCSSPDMFNEYYKQGRGIPPGKSRYPPGRYMEKGPDFSD